MSFQAYLDNIKIRTGKTPEDFKKLAAKKGLLGGDVKARDIVAWLKKEFDLGHGHAMAIYTVLKAPAGTTKPLRKSIEEHFSGKRSSWRAVFDSMVNAIREFGDDVSIIPANTYLSIARGSRKMAVIQIAVGHMDIGIKLKGAPPTKRFRAAGTWNAMMTHRLRILSEEQVDDELINWLRSAYEQNFEID